jgi:hypothetical protein
VDDTTVKAFVAALNSPEAVISDATQLADQGKD